MATIYDYNAKDINGKDVSFKAFKGKKILIVNTASNCGYTPQYEELEALYQANKDHLVIVGFPTNDFGGQEPGTNKEIAQFCKKNYGVTFPMMEKISVKDKAMHEVYTYLTQKSINGVMDSTVKWNFQKYLIDENGVLVKMYESKITPMNEELVKAIQSKSKKG